MEQNKSASPKGRPRGRPRAFDRPTVFKAMREVFWERGYAAASLDDLCQAAGINRPSLYNAFGEKADVFRAVLDDYIAEVRPSYEAAFRAPGALSESLLRVFDTSLSLWKAHEKPGLGCFMIGAALTDSLRDPEVGQMILDRLKEMDKGFLWRFRKAIEEGELAADADVYGLTMLASSLHNAMAVRLRAGEAPDQTHDYVVRALRLIGER